MYCRELRLVAKRLDFKTKNRLCESGFQNLILFRICSLKSLDVKEYSGGVAVSCYTEDNRPLVSRIKFRRGTPKGNNVTLVRERQFDSAGNVKLQNNYTNIQKK